MVLFGGPVGFFCYLGVGVLYFVDSFVFGFIFFVG